MIIQIDHIRDTVDRRFVGFRPNTTSVKPVHIANGMFRTILEKTFDTKILNQFVFHVKDNGQVPPGHELDAIYKWLEETQRIYAQEVIKENIKSFRLLLKKVVNADEGVYLHDDLMESYTAGFASFITKDRIAQSGGEFVATWLRLQHSPLLGSINSSLQTVSDPITVLCLPLVNEESSTYVPIVDYERLEFFSEIIESSSSPLMGLGHAAETLSRHLQVHPNKLWRLRLSVLFACFVVVRYLTCLESQYVPRQKLPPMLLDFSQHDAEPVAHASLMTYTYACQSITRFYAWAFGEHLRTHYSYDELKSMTASYKGRPPTKDIKEIWQLALSEQETSPDPFSVLGQALYDIMALEAEGDPIRYFRQLGIRSGIMWPPVNLRPTKRFAINTDMLEVLIRGAVEPNEPPLDLPKLQDRLWSRFGVIIGGRAEDERLLLDSGIYQASGSALRENRSRFAAQLGKLEFAKLLADGVLQVGLESSYAN